MSCMMTILLVTTFSLLLTCNADNALPLPIQMQSSRYLGGSKSRKSRDNRNNRNDDSVTGSGGTGNPKNNCIDQQDPFYVENKNVVISCRELGVNNDNLFACSWPEVSRRCPCACRKYDPNDIEDYDDVYNYGNDKHDDGGGNGGTGNCEDVTHPINIYRDYEKVLVYCSDLRGDAACDRARVKRKCPVACKVCHDDDDDDHEDDYNGHYHDNYHDNHSDGDTSCADSTGRFQVFHKNGKEVFVRCSTLLQNGYRYLCKRKRPSSKCPVTCRACDDESEDDDSTHGYKDDDNSNHGYKDDDDSTYGYKDDDNSNHGYKDDDDGTHGYHGYKDDDYSYNHDWYFDDDDNNIFYFDDNFY